MLATGFTATAPRRPPLGSPSEMVLRLCIHPTPTMAATSSHVKRERAEKGRREAFRLVEDVDVRRHYLRPFGDESSGCVTMLTWKPAAPSSAVTCAIGSQMVSLSARTYTPFALPYFRRMVAARSLMLTSSVLSLIDAILGDGDDRHFLRAFLDGAHFRDIHFDAELHDVRGQHEDDEQHEHHIDERRDVDFGDGVAPPRLPDRYPPPLVEKAMRYSPPKLRSARLRNSSEKSSMRAPSSRIRWPK